MTLPQRVCEKILARQDPGLLVRRVPARAYLRFPRTAGNEGAETNA